jgi:IS5 family transposase
MSIDDSGIKLKVEPTSVIVTVADSHPLIQLVNALPWEELTELVLPDLKKTAKGCWWMGRPLRLRIHLGAFLLQQCFNKTDRQTEYAIKDNAAYQLFCGKTIVKKWHCPDHTKIEEFRSRLMPETQQALANYMAVVAQRLGFAEPSVLDIDSTIQAANMAYPTDVHLLTQLAIKASKVWGYMKSTFSTFMFDSFDVDLKGIKQIARKYYFDKTSDKEKKNSLLSDVWLSTFNPVMTVTRYISVLTEYDFNHMPWNIKKEMMSLKEHAHDHFVNVTKFLLNGCIEPTKRLAFHIKEVACFNKQKPGIKYQFGRAFQLGRIGGNFLIVAKNDSIRMEDKQSVKPMIELHQTLFPKVPSLSVATDKGYYSKANVIYLEQQTGSHLGLQKPVTVESNDKSPEIHAQETELINRRAGIEPLIGHAKHGGQLRRSRMKYDSTTESAGYCAILGFNGRQLIRCLVKKAS